MTIKDKAFKKYDEEFILEEDNAKRDRIRSEIQSMLDTYTEKDSNCYHLLGLLDYESDDWEDHLEKSIQNFKKAVELDQNNVLPQLYLAHCYHDLNQLELALENYQKVNKEKLKEFLVWRYVKLIEQIGYCYYKLGNRAVGEQHFEKVLEWYKKLPKIDRVVPSELMDCLPDDHDIVIAMKKIEDYL